MNSTIDCERRSDGQRPGPAIAVTVVAIGSLIGLTDWSDFGHVGSLFALDIVVSAISIALLPVLLRWPVPATIALIALAAMSPAATHPPRSASYTWLGDDLSRWP